MLSEGFVSIVQVGLETAGKLSVDINGPLEKRLWRNFQKVSGEREGFALNDESLLHGLFLYKKKEASEKEASFAVS